MKISFHPTLFVTFDISRLPKLKECEQEPMHAMLTKLKKRLTKKKNKSGMIWHAFNLLCCGQYCLCIHETNLDLIFFITEFG